MSFEHEHPPEMKARGADVGSDLGSLILAITDPTDITNARAEAYQTLTGEVLTEEVFDHYSDLTIDWGHESDIDFGRFVVLRCLRQILDGKMELSNLLQNWPVYEHFYTRYIQKHESQAEGFPDHANNALLVGSLHPLTQKTFTVQANEIYGVNRAITIDLRGTADKARHGTFLRADGTNMPFADNTMRIVQTNHLFHWLGEEQWKGRIRTKEERALEVVREAFRVLHPGGHIMLCETGIGANLEAKRSDSYRQKRTRVLKKMLEAELPAIGFVDIVMEPGTQESVTHLFDPTRDLNKYPSVKAPFALAVCARKPFPAESRAR